MLYLDQRASNSGARAGEAAAAVYSDFMRESGFEQNSGAAFYVPKLAAEHASAVLLSPEGIPLGFEFNDYTAFLSFMKRGGAKLYARMNYTALQLGLREIYFGHRGAVFRRIGRLTGLRFLSLSGLRIDLDNIKDLKKLSELRVLDLGNTQFGRRPGELMALAVFSKLLVLDLSDNNVEDASFAELAPFKHLRSLRLSGNRLSRASRVLFPRWKELRVLDVSFNSPNRGASDPVPLEVETLAPLHSLTQLEVLVAKDGPFWGEGWGEFLSRTPLLRVLDIGSPLGESVVEVSAGSRLSGLEVFSINRGRIGKNLIHALGGARGMRVLSLRDAGLNNADAAVLGQFQLLEALDVSRNDFEDDGAKQLSHFPKLHTLQITSNRLTALGARALSRLPALVRLDIENNQLTDAGVLTLAEAPALKELKCRQQRRPEDSSRGSSLGPAPSRDTIAQVEERGVMVSPLLGGSWDIVDYKVRVVSTQIMDEIEGEIARTSD